MPKERDQIEEIDDSVLRHYVLAELPDAEAEHRVRVTPAPNWRASGYRDLIRVQEGLDVLIGDIKHEEERTISSDTGTAVLKFHFRVSGTSLIGMEGQEPVPVAPQTVGLLLQSPETQKWETYKGGEHEQSVTLLCAREYLLTKLEGQSQVLPADVRAFLSGEVASGFVASHPLSADMARAALSLIQSPYCGALSRIQAESRALELLLLSVQALVDSEAKRDRPERNLSRREIERLNGVREVLAGRFLDPPSIRELARHAGTNEAKLMNSFKQLYGQTVFDYAQRLRMEKAKTLLEETDLSITEIAFQVGYEYSSNFTTAFKRFFGVTPRTTRDAMR